MKDLYRRNKLKALETDLVKINNSIGDFPEDNEAVFSILLHANRKQRYDEVFATLKLIAQLRKHFDLKEKNKWERNYADFVKEEDSKLETKKNESSSPVPKKAKALEKNKSLTKYYFIGIACVLTIIAIFSGPGKDEGSFDENVSDELTIEKYALNKVPLYQHPDLTSNMIGSIPQFEDVLVYTDNGTRQWDFLEYGELQGYAQKERLMEGSGEAAAIQQCRRLGVGKPESGSPLIYSRTGPHTLFVVNPPGDDAAFKLRNMEGREVIFYYIQGGQTLTLNDIPEGEYQFSYATGKNFSSACGRFLDDMRAWKSDDAVTFKMEKNDQGEQPTSESFSLKNQFSVNVPIEAKNF